ncbi:MAG: glycoside hydrolase family 2 TIM barrel-domain containing protein [Lentisphaeria bacterium]
MRKTTLHGQDWLQAGGFVVGCNYWASHAGTRMWQDWRPDVVKKDLQRLRRDGVQVLRVFPLWPDFQPLTLLRTGQGPVEFRHGEAPLPDDPCGQAGMSGAMMERFAECLDLLAAQELRGIVGLLTGWMSGRLFVPPAFDGLQVLTDPTALRWQVRFVRHFVSAFKHHPAVLAWDLGNECNCMGQASRDQAYAWTALITQTIRAADDTRPVVSGLHSLSPSGNWTPFDQGELTDLLTVHPYPVFTPHCDQDPLNTVRTILHGTAECRFYADLGGKPCLCEEIGTLGTMISSEKIAADFLRAALFSLWANDCHGLLWWCASDQTHLEHAPYDWCTVERELGLLRIDGRAKPVLKEIGAFRRMLDGLPFTHLPPRTREAVCLLTEGQDNWGVAYSAFILAKQAGFDLEFQHASQPLKDAPFYLLPCLAGHLMISRRRTLGLLARVEAGATLYVSLDDGLPDGFEALTGLEPQTRQRGRDPGEITVEGIAGLTSIPNSGTFKVDFRATRATVLGREAGGNPAFTVASYGKGRVYFLAVPMEMTLATTPGAFHSESASPCWRVYRHIAEAFLERRAVRKTNPLIGLTEHCQDASNRIMVIVNHSPHPVREDLILGHGWKLKQVLHGEAEMEREGLAVTLNGNDACILSVTRSRK